MKEIRGDAKNMRTLLSGAKYAIDYYQREYKWDTKQVRELLDDLTSEFLEDYEVGHERSHVETYGHYFLGSIIISDKEGQKFIIDGQQRLTTLTLLLKGGKRSAAEGIAAAPAATGYLRQGVPGKGPVGSQGSAVARRSRRRCSSGEPRLAARQPSIGRPFEPPVWVHMVGDMPG